MLSITLPSRSPGKLYGVDISPDIVSSEVQVVLAPIGENGQPDKSKLVHLVLTEELQVVLHSVLEHYMGIFKKSRGG